MGRSDAARFWKKLKTDGQSRRGRCSEGLRISTSEEEAEGMRSGGQELAQDGRGWGEPFNKPTEAWFSLWGVQIWRGRWGAKESKKNDGRHREEGAWKVRVMSARAWRASIVESWGSQTLWGAWRRRGLWGIREPQTWKEADSRVHTLRAVYNKLKIFLDIVLTGIDVFWAVNIPEVGWTRSGGVRKFQRGSVLESSKFLKWTTLYGTELPIRRGIQGHNHPCVRL